MRRKLGHRGPDGVGHIAAEGIALGHTRLSIIDLSGGRQPLTNEDETIFLVANGEIYNYRVLQRELLKSGHRLTTGSDCEVILHLYEDYGEDCIEHLEGMFAFALWDGRQKRLLLARDRFGIKPLYYAFSGRSFCFASELLPILHSGLVEAELDPQSLYSYMAFSYVPGPSTIFREIKKVQPAQRILLQGQSLQKCTYWTPQHVFVPRNRSDAMEELKQRLERAVRSHLIADVPVAAFLSGGVDSSTVVAMAPKHIETLCVSFPGKGIDEAPIARRVAGHLGTNHREVSMEMNPTALLVEAIDYFDEPFADSSALPTFALCRAARKIAKVVLSGDGGDEVFGGYTGRYRVSALKSVLPGPAAIGRLLKRLPPWRSGQRSSLPAMMEMAGLADADRYIVERQITSVADRASLFGGDENILESETGLLDVAKKPLAGVAHLHPVQRALWMDLMTSLPDDMLTKVDRMSMAHGLEVRVPFLDHHLVEFALSLPASWLVSPLPVEGKRLLRQVAAPMLPLGLLDRPKHGFVAPLNEWLKNSFLPIFDNILAESNVLIFRFLDPSGVRNLRQRPLEGQPRSDLYALLVLELWMRRITKDIQELSTDEGEIHDHWQGLMPPLRM